MRRPRLRKAITFLAFGIFGAAVLPTILALSVNLTNAASEVNSTSTGTGQWTVTRWDRLGGVRLQSIREKGRNWSVSQATGAPDTPTGGDQVTAWASATSDSSREWITLDFATAVVPRAVHVFEMCSTGALDRVSFFNGDAEVTAWSGTDPMPAGRTMGTADVPVDGTFKTSRVKLYLNSPAFSGWNEIDAVSLEDAGGNIQWAISAQASSQYGSWNSGIADVGTLAAMMPAWSGLRGKGVPAVGVPPIGGAEIIEARGWPLVSMAGRRQLDPGTVTSTSASYYGSGPISSGRTLALSPPPFIPASTVGSTPIVPSRVIPMGFALDSLFYAIVLAGLVWIASVPRRFFREAARVRSGRCIACGYDLRYDFVPGCPECGWNREQPDAKTNGVNGHPAMKPSAMSLSR